MFLPEVASLPKFPRFDAVNSLEDIDPGRSEYDKIKAAARFRSILDGQFISIELDYLLGVELTYARYGVTQPFNIRTGYRILEISLLRYGIGSVIRWLRVSDQISVDVFFSSTLYTGGGFVHMQSGFIDADSTDFGNETITFICRDNSELLWERRIFMQEKGAPTTEVVKRVVNLSEGDGRVSFNGLSNSGKKFSTIESFSDPRTVGELDQKGEKVLYIDGERAWDVVQALAMLDDAQCFMYKNALWYMRADTLRTATGRFLLTLGENLEDLELEHSISQSKDFAIVVSVTNTNQPGEVDEQGKSGDTSYLVMEDLRQGPREMSEMPSSLSLFSRKKIYHMARYNILGFDKVNALFREIIGEYRRIASKELVMTFTFAGHPYASPLEIYILRGMRDRALNDVEFIADSITHSFTQEQGWTTKVVGTNFLAAHGGVGRESGLSSPPAPARQ